MDRVEKSFKWIEEQSEERLATREKVQLARLDRLVRPLE
jgi:hypothetical protein